MLAMFHRRICSSCYSPLSLQLRGMAGHNKWSNIKHVKGAKDALKAKQNKVMVSRIVNAIKEKNGDNNPDSNSQLKKILSEANSLDVPKATIQNALKNHKSEDTFEVMHEVVIPGGIVLLCQCLVKNKNQTAIVVNPILKKKGGLLEKGSTECSSKFQRKGIILCEVSKEVNLEDIEDVAIEAGAEEVNIISEEQRMVEFVTSDLDLNSVLNQLKESGYKNLEGNLIYTAVHPANPEPVQIKVAERVIESLEELDIVISVHRNY